MCPNFCLVVNITKCASDMAPSTTWVWLTWRGVHCAMSKCLWEFNDAEWDVIFTP